MKIIGAGFGRTGTLSLKLALEQLGFDPCYHMLEVHKNPTHIDLWRAAARGEPVDWPAMFERYDAWVDWPASAFWRQQLQSFPDAKVILSLRDSQDWYQSVMNTIWPSSSKLPESEDAGARMIGEMVFEVVWDPIFSRRMDDKDHVIACFEKHNQAVIDEVPEEQLLVYRPGDGWAPICEFLGLDIPASPYPKVNTTEDFQKRANL